MNQGTLHSPFGLLCSPFHRLTPNPVLRAIACFARFFFRVDKEILIILFLHGLSSVFRSVFLSRREFLRHHFRNVCMIACSKTKDGSSR